MTRKNFARAVLTVVLFGAVVLPLLLVAGAALAASPAASDPRYCGPPARTEDGRILRSREVLREFKALHPCPSTGRATGACPGWALDHVVPLGCGACDAVVQWLPVEIKSASGALPKDRWERRVYCKALRLEPVRDGDRFMVAADISFR